MALLWEVGGPCEVKGVGREVRQVGDAPLEATTAHPGGESSGTKVWVRGVGMGAGGSCGWADAERTGLSREVSGLPM